MISERKTKKERFRTIPEERSVAKRKNEKNIVFFFVPISKFEFLMDIGVILKFFDGFASLWVQTRTCSSASQNTYLYDVYFLGL